MQVALKAVKASVEPAETERYQRYDAKHGAHYVSLAANGATMEDASDGSDWD